MQKSCWALLVCTQSLRFLRFLIHQRSKYRCHLFLRLRKPLSCGWWIERFPVRTRTSAEHGLSEPRIFKEELQRHGKTRGTTCVCVCAACYDNTSEVGRKPAWGTHTHARLHTHTYTCTCMHEGQQDRQQYPWSKEALESAERKEEGDEETM